MLFYFSPELESYCLKQMDRLEGRLARRMAATKTVKVTVKIDKQKLTELGHEMSKVAEVWRHCEHLLRRNTYALARPTGPQYEVYLRTGRDGVCRSVIKQVGGWASQSCESCGTSYALP